MSETMIVIAVIVCLLAGLAAGGLIVWLSRPRAVEPDRSAELGLMNLNARLDAMGSWLQNAHGQLHDTVNQRLDAVSQNLGVSMQNTTKHTVENLQKLNERLAVIDIAQKNITDLATQVTSLQNVLTNKQSRGAFGQGQLEAIIADVLPKGAYAFQHTLSNRMRPDCAIFFPDSHPLIIDAKFPLEAMTAWQGAANDEERKFAVARVRQDIAKHVGDIAEKYLIPGETQEIALMFIPSESVYAELHERFDDVVQKAQRSHVMIVSPTLLVLAIQVVKHMRKDAQIREAADQLRGEVGHMIKDVGLLSDRVRKLQNHFGMTTKDMEDILTSTGRIEKRAAKIEGLEFDEPPSADILPGPGQLKLGAGE